MQYEAYPLYNKHTNSRLFLMMSATVIYSSNQLKHIGNFEVRELLFWEQLLEDGKTVLFLTPIITARFDTMWCIMEGGAIVGKEVVGYTTAITHSQLYLNYQPAL